MKKGKKYADRIWQAGLVFSLLLLLCGCTKKEELLLLSETDAGEMAAGSPAEGVLSENDGNGAFSEASLQADTAPARPEVIYVHVCGAVAHPGVYELEAGSRVYEAVGQAGGFSESADQNYVNQAQTLEDGVMLVIPTKEEAADAREREKAAAAGEAQTGVSGQIGIVRDGTVAGTGVPADSFGILGGTSRTGQDTGAGAASLTGKDTGEAAALDGRININTASEAQLCEIPGVGATRAAAIAAYRETHGPFEKPEDIMKVSGIKEGMYEKIKDSISVK